ncbi:MAG: endonuclease/exonuclease/phosphatase family protein [Pseudomonadota bacterium]
MAPIHDNPPAAVRRDLDALSQALDVQIPAPTPSNLLICTWNIRSFASLTRRWTATGSDSPKRDLRGLRAIIEIIRRFDVIAVQELKGDLRALRDTLSFLGPD